MREIKFRVWNKDLKEMTYQDERGWFEQSFIGNNGYLQSCSLGVALDRNGKDLEVLQYTGLKDKNGKEIYEGDIVKGYWWDKGKQHRHIGRVAYVMNAFNVRGVKQYLGYDDGLNPSYEVIGNIYENPELLEEGK